MRCMNYRQLMIKKLKKCLISSSTLPCEAELKSAARVQITKTNKTISRKNRMRCRKRRREWSSIFSLKSRIIIFIGILSNNFTGNRICEKERPWLSIKIKGSYLVGSATKFLTIFRYYRWVYFLSSFFLIIKYFLLYIFFN